MWIKFRRILSFLRSQSLGPECRNRRPLDTATPGWTCRPPVTACSTTGSTGQRCRTSRLPILDAQAYIDGLPGTRARPGPRTQRATAAHYARTGRGWWWGSQDARDQGRINGRPDGGQEVPPVGQGRTLADNPGTCVSAYADQSTASRSLHPEVARWERHSRRRPDDLLVVQFIEGSARLPSEPAPWIPRRFAAGVVVNVSAFREAVHSDPVWRDRSNFIIATPIEPGEAGVTAERLWARRVDDRHYQLCCIPFFAYDLALGDVIEIVRGLLGDSGLDAVGALRVRGLTSVGRRIPEMRSWSDSIS